MTRLLKVQKKKKLIWVILLAAAFFPVLAGRVPALPSSKSASAPFPLTDIRQYLAYNLFAILFSVIALFLGIFILAYGAYLHRRIRKYEWGKAGISLGLFILLSGIWVLTDSRILDVFTTSSGGALDSSVVHYFSFLSFMLLPLVFLSFLRLLTFDFRGMSVIEALLMLNFTVFLALIFLGVPKNIYFFSLLTHHFLMFLLMILASARHGRNFFCPTDRQKQNIARGVLLFMVFSIAALLFFLFSRKQVYAALYGTGFLILILYMIKILVHRMTTAYQEILTLDTYKALSYTDVLTGVKNRNAFMEYQKTLRIDGQVCLVVADVNGLKQINDLFGHRLGDEIICRAAQALQEAFSSLGVCYRIGGDEFAVICEHADEEAVKAALAGMKLENGKETDAALPRISLACGYAFGGGGIDTPQALFDAADKAMYRDKNSAHAPLDV